MNPQELENLTPPPTTEMLHDHAGGDSVKLKVSNITGDIRATVYTLVPSNKLRVSADTLAVGYDLGFTKKKEIQVTWGGTIRVSFLYLSIDEYRADFSVYLNGVASPMNFISTTAVSPWQSFSIDVGISPGDTIQLYARNLYGGGYQVCNFRIYWDEVKNTSIPAKYTVNIN